MEDHCDHLSKALFATVVLQLAFVLQMVNLGKLINNSNYNNKKTKQKPIKLVTYWQLHLKLTAPLQKPLQQLKESMSELTIDAKEDPILFHIQIEIFVIKRNRRNRRRRSW